MITYIHGELTEILVNSIVVEAYGVGYEIMIPESCFNLLPHIGTEVKIFTYQYVKEDILDLYGFLSRDDLNIFKLLITVSGIGPKGGLSILSAISPDDLRIAVATGDVKKIQSAPGIGNKTAQKLIIELKDKISIEDVLYKDTDLDGVNESEQIRNDAIEALVSLGYSVSDSAKTVSSLNITDDMSSEDVLRAALKKMAFI